MAGYDGIARSLSGHVLMGDRAVKFIFIDEAGTSGAQREQARVVAAVIVDADRQLLRAEALLDEALASVPARFSSGFVFHAEEIMNAVRYREYWRLTDRVNLLCDVMSIPRRLKMPIAFGYTRADSPKAMGNVAVPGRKPRRLKPFEEDAILAFQSCVGRADKLIRDYGEPDEIGTIVAERSDLQRMLGTVPSLLREKPIVAGPEHLVDRQIDIEQGYNSQDGVMKVTRIRKTIHFVGKNEDRMIWLSDAIAYGLKRFFNRADFGEVFYKSIGGKINRDDFDRSELSSFQISFD